MAGDPPPPPPPPRKLDTVTLEGLGDLVNPASSAREQIKSREFPEFQGLDMKPSDVKVVLFDANSMDSFAACYAARELLGESARYEGVDRSGSPEILDVDVHGKVVAMLGVSWLLEAMHGLVAECELLLIFETHMSAIRELEQFSYPSAIRVFEPDMGAAALAWNFFWPAVPVPPLLRALEEAELGRGALLNAAALVNGCETAVNVTPPRGEVTGSDSAFDELKQHLQEDGGRATIARAIEEGNLLAPGIQAQCSGAERSYAIRILRAFPAWRCALVNSSSPFSGRLAEHLAARLTAECGAGAEHRCFAMAFEVRRRNVRAVLRSCLGVGPDVSEVAAQFEGSGHPHHAFFSVPLDVWESLWVEPEPVLWDAEATGPHQIQVRRGDFVTVARRGERFKDSPFDEWSWGYKCSQPSVEGWIPTLAHTLMVATKAAPPTGNSILGLDEGDLLVAQGQRGEYFWGFKLAHAGSDCLSRDGAGAPKGWFPCIGGLLQPVHGPSARAFLSGGFA